MGMLIKAFLFFVPNVFFLTEDIVKNTNSNPRTVQSNTNLAATK